MNNTTFGGMVAPTQSHSISEPLPRFYVHHTTQARQPHASAPPAKSRGSRARTTTSCLLPIVAAHPVTPHHYHHYVSPSAIHHRHLDGASVLGVLVLFVVYAGLVVLLIATSAKPPATHQSAATSFRRPLEELRHGFSLPLEESPRAKPAACVPPASAPVTPSVAESTSNALSTPTEATVKEAAAARREKALDLLKKARQLQTDPIVYRQTLAELVRNYGNTPAGEEALNLLAAFEPGERKASAESAPATSNEPQEVSHSTKQDAPKVLYGLGFMQGADPAPEHQTESVIRQRFLSPNAPDAPGDQNNATKRPASPEKNSGEEQKRADFLAAYNGQRADKRLVSISKLSDCKAQRSIETLYFVSWLDADPEVRSRAFSALIRCEDTYGYTAYLAADSFKRENEPGVKIEKAVAMGSLRYRWSALNELVSFLGSLRWRWWWGWSGYSRSGGYVVAGTPPLVSSSGPAPVEDREYDLWRQREPLRWRSENELMAIVGGVINRLSGTKTESRPRIDQEIVKWWDRKSELWAEYDRKLREKTLSDSKPVQFKVLQGMRDDEIQPGKDMLHDGAERVKHDGAKDNKEHAASINDE
jgi:hypothetical protein